MQVALLLTALASALDVCVLFHSMVLLCTSVRGPLRERMLIESEQSTSVQDSPLWTALSSALERNNSARDVAISSSTRSKVAATLLEELCSVEEASRARTWYARVPSAANVADEPSRNLCPGLRWRHTWRLCTPVGPALESVFSRFG